MIDQNMFTLIKNYSHSSWHEVLYEGVTAINARTPDYFTQLNTDYFLPHRGHIFAAFSVPRDQVRFVLLGEAPYPRAASANGYSFMDGAVMSLWRSDGGGLSREVNRATSLRNFVKMLLLADGLLSADNTNDLLNVPRTQLIQSGAQLQANLLARGFLLLNAALVFRPNITPQREAAHWQALLNSVMRALAGQAQAPTCLLWGNIAQATMQRCSLETFTILPTLASEHPYNLSFIHNAAMQELFRPLRLLHPM